MDKPTISKLFSDAAKRLRTEFEFIRSSQPHSAEKGIEVENILKSFLNSHLPHRFCAGSGIIIDNDNTISKQTDVIIYDVFSSPIYRYAENAQIIPADTVASVIEVKTCLNKSEIKDGYEKIASCKQLKKRPFSQLDQKSTGSELATVGTFGVIFGFDSDTSLETLADNIGELNKDYESRLWPDMVVVLDKGILSYGISYPGEENLAGELATPCGDDFQIPPFYVHLIVHKDGEFSLNRFFCNLLSHLTFYPRRPSTPPFDTILEGAPKQVRIIKAYQHNTKRQLKPAPSEMHIENKPKPPVSMGVKDENDRQIGLLQFIPWQDGAVIRWYGRIPLQDLLGFLLSKPEGIVIKQPHSDAQLSSVLNITEEDFRRWPEILAKNTDLTGSLEYANST